MMRRMRLVGRSRGERGVVGGIEALPFGLLIFVCGTLLLANVWAVVDAKLAVEDAARQAGRAYAESGAESASGAADRAARQAMAGAGRDPSRLTISASRLPFRRCGIVEHQTSYQVAAIKLPFIGGFGRGFTVQGSHRDVIDPFRSGIEGDGAC